MRALATELKKLFSNKIFLLIIAAVFVLNGYLIFRTANSGDAKPSDYKYIYSELEGLTDSEKLAVFDERINNSTQGLYDYNWELYYELANECYDIVNYKSYLENIETQAESMQSISIFANPDTFNYRNIVKTPSAYQSVQEVQPVFDVSQGIILATDNSYSDILIGFILLFAVLSVMISDREQGMSCLLFSLKRGRSYLLFTKLIALAITAFASVLLIYAENFIIAGGIYGLGDLSRPIQSLNGFIGCNLKISVFQYLIIYVFFKFFAVFAIGVVLSLIAVNTKNTVSFYGISAIILISEGVLYTVIHPLSVYSIFRYINLISFTKVNEIFCNYKNINFWEYPIPLIPTSIGTLLIIMLVCAALSAFLYAKKRNLEFRKIGFKFKIGKRNRMHSRLYYTLYKSLILQRGIFVIAAFIVIFAFVNESFIKKYDYVDVYYRYYTEQLEGEIDDETETFMMSEAQRFESLNAQAEELMQTSDVFSAELNDIQKQLAPSAGFYLLQERYEQIKNISNARIFYDTGYKRALGITGYDDDMKYALTAMLLCIFLVSPLIANDNKYRMKSVINSTASGNKSYIRRNILIACIYGLISALLWIIPYAVTISSYYGHDGLSGSVRSITDLIDFSLNLTLWQYILIICLLRIIAVIFSSLTMLWISSKCRNTTSAILINFAVFALPIIVYLLGAKIMVNVGFSPLLSVNVMLNCFSVVQIVMPIVIAVGIICLNKKIKNW